MYSCQDTSLEDFNILFERYDLKPSISLEVPTFFYSFRENDQLVGYGKLTIREGQPHLEAFKVDASKEGRIFFLKALGYKVFQLGFESFIDEEGHAQALGIVSREVALEDLFEER